MPTTLEECIRRIQSDESRAHNRKLNEKLAAEWFEKYDASRRSDEIPPLKFFRGGKRTRQGATCLFPLHGRTYEGRAKARTDSIETG